MYTQEELLDLQLSVSNLNNISGHKKDIMIKYFKNVSTYQEIIYYCKTNKVDSFANLVDYCSIHRKDWFILLLKPKYMKSIIKHIKKSSHTYKPGQKSNKIKNTIEKST